jgi:hypothetical protein
MAPACSFERLGHRHPLGVVHRADVRSPCESIGLGIVVAYLTYQLDMQDMKDDSEPTKDLCRRIFTGLVKPLLCVGAGWVYLKVFW